MWFKAVASIGAVAALIIGAVWITNEVSNHFKDYEAKKTRLVLVEKMLTDSRNEVAALQAARQAENQAATESYEKADWACQETVKQVVAGTKVVRVPVEEYVYVETPGSCPRVDLPPLFRLRDVQNAGKPAAKD